MSATRTDSPGAVATLYARLVALCSDFKLPTLGAELVPRFQKAGREDIHDRASVEDHGTPPGRRLTGCRAFRRISGRGGGAG